MPTMEFIREEDIEGDGASTGIQYWNVNLDGRDIQVTTTITSAPNGSEIIMFTSWHNDSPVVSTMVIGDNISETINYYVSEQGGPFQPVTIIGGGGRNMLPPEEFNLDQ